MCDYVVYVHTNLVNNKVYIGMTNNVERRWKNNGLEYKPSKYNTRPFWNAIEKYGWDSFKHEILDDNLTFEDACEIEKYYIKISESQDNKKGYNVACGGNGGHIYKEHPKGMLGKKHSEEFRKNLSEKMKGENNPFYGKDWGKNHPKGMLGKKHSDESKRKTSETLKNKKINCKPFKIIFPNGDEIIFDKKQDVIEYLGVSYDFVTKLEKTKIPYKQSNNKNSNSERLKSLEGIMILKLDNTEENQEIKES